MSQYGLFWNSRSGDRTYNADDFATWLRKFFTTGVFEGELFVTSAGGMNITVGSGYCNIEGKVMFFDADQSFTLDTAYPEASRIDAVIVERNDADRVFTCKVVKGSTDGLAPVPIRTGGIYQLVLAYINVGAAVTEITQANITDKRLDSSVCGYVAGTVDTVDWSQITAQWQAYFNEWFANLQYVLDGDVAGHLQNEINYLDNGKENIHGWTSITLSAANWVEDTDGTHYYSFESLYPSTDYDITEVLPCSTTTMAMRNAWILADCGGYEDSNIIRSYGVVPEIDIVIGICIKAKGGVIG